MTNRRGFLMTTAAAVGASCFPGTLGLAGTENSSSSTVGDKLWIWAHPAGSHNAGYGIEANSRMTPAEGAFYLGTPNLLMVSHPNPDQGGKVLPVPPFDGYAISFRPLKRVVWSLVGAGGHYSQNHLDEILSLAERYPNITGVQLDDFFRPALGGGVAGVLTPQEVRYLQHRLHEAQRKLELWVTYYDADLKNDLTEFLSSIDVVTYWTWHAKDLMTMEDRFAQLEKKAPENQKVLGCYLWDYGAQKPMPIELMKKQCEVGLRWLKERKIEGMIFLASCICDLNLDAVEWTRKWISEVKNETL